MMHMWATATVSDEDNELAKAHVDAVSKIEQQILRTTNELK